MLKNILYWMFGLLGAGIMCFGLWLLAWGMLSNHWPSTTGRIFLSHIEDSHHEDGTTYGAAVTYEYTIDDRRFVSHRVLFGSYSSSDSRHASKILSGYPAGKIVTVYYNPVSPSMAVLERGIGGGAFIPLGLGAAIIGMVLIGKAAEKQNAAMAAAAQAGRNDPPFLFDPKETRLPEDFEKKRIEVSRDSPRVLTNYPPVAIILGMLFFPAGLALAVFGASKKDGALFVILGLSIAIFGGSLAWFAFKGIRLRRMRDQASGRSPWLYDFLWDHNGASDGSFKKAFRMLYAVTMFTAFVIPLQILMLEHATEQRVILSVMLGIFDLAIVAAVGKLLYLFARARKYGNNRLLFHSFPIPAGQDMTVVFAADRLLHNQTLHAELQYISEYYESHGSGNSRTTWPVHELLYSQAGEFRTDARGVAKLVFRIPPDAGSTDLIGSPPRYWELVITAKVPGIDYRGIFLLPIYRM